jgi:hypothetical protein
MSMRRWKRTAALAAVMVAGLATLATAQHRPANALNWAFGGAVHTVTRAGRVAFVGGRFNAVAPRTHVTGGFVVLSVETSHRAMRNARVHGNVNAIVSDGAGGWFVGGNFTFVGSERRPQIVHLLADGRVDSAWTGRVNGRVLSLALVGPALYVGGEFTHAGSGASPAIATPRQNVAAFAATDGSLLATTAGGADGAVHVLAAAGATLYAGGDFSIFGGASRSRLAAYDTAASVVTAWNPSADAVVRAIVPAADAQSIYVGGSFVNAGGAARAFVAQIDATTGLATAWNPGANAGVSALALLGDTVYIGGAFTQLGGSARNRAGAVNRASGALTSWDPNADDVVQALSIAGSTVYLGGQFLNVGGRTRLHAAAVDAVTGALAAWHPALNDPVRALVATAERVAAGGSFEAIGAYRRRNLAAIDLDTGRLLPWRPHPDGAVLALEVARDRRLYVGGNFTTIAGQARARLAAFDLATRGLSSWNPDADGAVLALAPYTDDTGVTTIYAGGDFALAGGQARSRLAAIAGTTGLALAGFAPGATDDSVFSLRIDANHVYAGGRFTSLAGSGLAYLGRVDRTTGAADATWAPSPGDVVRAVELGPNVVYAGGLFTTIAGQARAHVAALSLTAPATATGWAPNPNRAVNAIDRDGGLVFLGGTFSQIDGIPRPRLGAVFAATTGPGPYLLPWRPRWLGVVHDIDARLEGVVVGGEALPDLDDQEFDPVGRVAFYPRAGAPGRPGPPTDPNAEVSGSSVHLEWGEPLSGADPLGYLLYVGSRRGADDIANGFRVTPETFLDVNNVPPGRYHLRIRSFNLSGVSAPSEEVVFEVSGARGCGGAPIAPADLDVVVNGGLVTLTWAESPTAGVTGYRIEAGAAGGPFTFSTVVPASTTTLSVPAPPGAFDVRVRALSACGESTTSNTSALSVGGAMLPPGAPEGLAATVTGSVVSITWAAPSTGGPVSGYVLEAGSGPGLTDVTTVPATRTTLGAAGVPSGVYFVRVRAVNTAGAGAVSDEIQVVVP